MPVPPKDPAQRRRRNLTGAQKTLLPAGGRRKAAPRWPLSSPKPAAWSYLWKLPHAAAWEAASMVRIVARYAILLEDAETSGAPAALLAEVRQMEDRLGLNPKAMRSLLWEVAPDEVAEKREAEPVTQAETKRQALRIAG